MATNFLSVDTFKHSGFTNAKKRFRSLLSEQDDIVLTGVAPTATKLTLNFDRIPILTGQAAVYSNWTISGGITVTAVAVVGTTIEIDTSGTYGLGDYTLTVPTGITASSGIDGFPFLYYGPYGIVYALGATGRGGSLFNTGFN